MLAGHVHGGQVRVPVFGSLLVPSVYGRRYDCGTFEEGPTLLHVGRGISGEHPLRVACLPQVTRLVLRATPPGA
jgi:predicted MPP superfamily phosphohydrolase